MTRAARLSALLLLVACNHSSSDGASAAASATASPSASAGAAAALASAAPSASAAATSTGVHAWKGTYKTTPGALTVPADWSKTHWSSTDATTGVGEGALELSLDPTTDPTTQRVTGTLEGVAGPAVVEGTSRDGRIAASVRRKDPADRGFVGTLLASASADHLEGSLALASGDGAMLRSGTFTLAPASK